MTDTPLTPQDFEKNYLVEKGEKNALYEKVLSAKRLAKQMARKWNKSDEWLPFYNAICEILDTCFQIDNKEDDKK
jgi:hypothetical protein